MIVVAIISGAWFGYGEFSRKVKDLKNAHAQVNIPSGDLISEYEKDEIEANKKFLDKIIAVSGTVKTIDKNEQGYYTIVLGEVSSMSSVRCSMDSSHIKDIAGLNEGSNIVIKGACTGFNADELLGSDVILNRCVIEKKN